MVGLLGDQKVRPNLPPVTPIIAIACRAFTQYQQNIPDLCWIARCGLQSSSSSNAADGSCFLPRGKTRGRNSYISFIRMPITRMAPLHTSGRLRSGWLAMAMCSGGYSRLAEQRNWHGQQRPVVPTRF